MGTLLYEFDVSSTTTGYNVLKTVNLTPDTVTCYIRANVIQPNANEYQLGSAIKTGATDKWNRSAMTRTNNNTYGGANALGATSQPSTNIGSSSPPTTTTFGVRWFKTIWDFSNDTVTSYLSPAGATETSYLSETYSQIGVQSAFAQGDIIESLDLWNGTTYKFTLYECVYILEGDNISQIGGTATLPTIHSFVVNQNTSLGGGGVLTAKYDTGAELTTLLANQRKTVVIYSPDGRLRFKGDITRANIKTQENEKLVIYTLEEVIRKCAAFRCEINPVAYKSTIRRTFDASIYDHFAADDPGNPWTTNLFQNKYIITGDSNKYITTIHPLSKTDYSQSDPFGIVSDTPDATGGAIEYLYFRDADKTDEDSYAVEYSTAGRAIVDFGFKLWYKDDITFNTITLGNIIRFNSFAKSKMQDFYPAGIEIYNYVTTNYDTIYTYDRTVDGDSNDGDAWQNTSIGNDTGFTAGSTPLLTQSHDLLTLLGVSAADFKTNYLGNKSGENANGFRSSELIIRVLNTHVQSQITMYSIMEVHYLALTFQLDPADTAYSQAQQTSIGLISSNSTKLLSIDDTQAYSITDFPPADGVSAGDPYVIVSPLATQITDIDTQLTNVTIQTDFTSSLAGYADTRDLTYITLKDFINKWANVFNWVWFDRSTDSTNIIEIRDNLDSTGVTITSADIIDYPQRLEIVYDSKQIRETVIGIGADSLISSVTNTPTYSNTLGAESIIYRNDTLDTQAELDQFTTKMALRHKEAALTVSFELDLDNGPQSYAGLLVGKTLHINTDELDTTGGSELMIEMVQYFKLSDERNRLRIGCMRRTLS